MAVRQMDIQFKDPSATFRAGEPVSGNIVLSINGELRLKSVRLQLYGFSRVSWDTSKSYTKGSSSKQSHKHIDIYLDETVYLVSKTEALSGRKSWPFTVRLPAYIPASFDGQFGKVQYWAKLILERPWKGDTDMVKNFTVLGNLDLNTDVDAKKSAEANGEGMIGLMCKSGPIIGKIEIDRRGYVPGQNLPFKAKIENNCRNKLLVRVVLTQQSSYRVGGQTKRHTIVLKGLQQGDVEPGEELESSGEIKNLPVVPPSKLGGGCKHIEVKYFLTLVAVPGGLGNKDLEIPVEVTIGTMPLRRDAPTVPTANPNLKVKAAAKMTDSPKGSPRAPLAREI